MVSNVVKENIEVRIYPAKAQRNDKGEKIVNISAVESNIGISRFIYNKELEFINDFKRLLVYYGYDVDKIIVNDKSCNVILQMLKQEYSFIENAESSSIQQSQRDFIRAMINFYNVNLKAQFPVYKSKKTNKETFRIINNNNNVRIQKDKYGYDKIKLAKLGLVKFKTSKKYLKLLHQASDKYDPTVKIKHVTVKKVNDKYYAVFNIKRIHTPEKIIGPLQQVGIDIGCGKLAVLSNTQEIANLDLRYEAEKIIQYQKEMSHRKPGSTRYLKAKKQLNKWYTKLINKRNDYYDKITNYIVKNSSFIAVQNENIIAWKQNSHFSKKVQLNAPRTFIDKLEYKCQREGVEFIKIPKHFPSTQICSECGNKNKSVAGIGKIGIREWDCPHCNAHHDRDVNASKNILKKGLEMTVGTTVQ